MDRRALLAAAGTVGLAGCLSSIQPGRQGSSEGRSLATLAGARTVEYEKAWDVPGWTREEIEEQRAQYDDPPTFLALSELELATGASVQRDRITTERTAELAVSVTNERDETVSVDSVDYGVLGGRVSKSERPSRLALWPEDSEERPDRASEDCLQMSDGIAYAPDSPAVEYGPGEQQQNVYLPWMHHEATDCFPAGEYRFEQIYSTYGDDISVDVDGWIVTRWALVVKLDAA